MVKKEIFIDAIRIINSRYCSNREAKEIEEDADNV